MRNKPVPFWRVFGIFTFLAVFNLSYTVSDAKAEDWRETGCAGRVEKNLKTLDLGDLVVKDIKYFVRSEGGGQGGGTQSLDGWVSFENCKGNLIIRFNNSCGTKERYTTGQCEIKGVSNY
ncbi:MAG: hypothetical protein NXI13_05995 [Proteobacteria bacterium]|nr:hypothetical protein [Pseudomonadota bacterium]